MRHQKQNNVVVPMGPGSIGSGPTPPPLQSIPVTPLAQVLPITSNAPVSTADPGSSIGLQGGNVKQYGSTGGAIAAYKTLLAWAILLAFLYLISRSRAGYAAIYLSEWLILLFLFATQAQYFREKLTPITSMTQPTGM